MTEPEIQELIDITKKCIVFIDFAGNTTMPYTRAKNKDDKIEDKPTDVCLYNLVTNQYDYIPHSTVNSYTTWTLESGAPDEQRAQEKLDALLADISECEQDPAIDLSLTDIIARRCDSSMDELTWEILKHFKLKYTLPQIKHPDEQTLDQIKQDYVDIIREHRNQAFQELDELEAQAREDGASEDDIADIDIIKQMFRDIPQDIDLSQYTTVSDLYNFWPSLLLPKPGNMLDKAALDFIAAEIPDEVNIFEDAQQIINAVKSPHELNIFLAELGDLNKIPLEIVRMIKSRIRRIYQHKHRRKQ